MTTTASDPRHAVLANPYVGPNSIQYGQPIYGRDLETADLCITLVSHRVVLFYAPSGAGKSSLINAGLRPELEGRDFVVLPTIRVGDDVDPALGNRYVLSTLQSLEEARPAGPARPVEELARLGLAGYLSELRQLDDAGMDLCIVFDQFEELFTLDPTDQTAKKAFLDEVGRCLRDRSLWALFAMREDYIAQLDPHLSLIPTRFSTRFRLDLLGPDAAMDAARRPALANSVEFTELAASRLIDNIRSVRVRRGDVVRTEIGPYVEPVVLQVVCQRLWERVGASADSTIDVDDIDELGDVDDALADFCDDQIVRAEQANGVSQSQIRDWIDSELVGEQEFRTQTLSGPGPEGDAVIRSLADGHFLRSESRRGTNWYEIAHDRLVDPLIASNERWRLGPIQPAADRWTERGRPDALLLRSEILTKAHLWVDEHPSDVRSVDTEFLDSSRSYERRTAKKRRCWISAVLFALAALVVVAVYLFVEQRSAKQEADSQAEAATEAAGEAAMNASAIASQRPSQIVVPAVVGRSEAGASISLVESGLQVNVEYDDVAAGSAEDGFVVAQINPQDSTVAPDTQITIIVGRARSEFVVPAVVGRSEAGALDSLVESGLRVNVEYEDVAAGSAEDGFVVAQSIPQDSTVAPDTQITIAVGRAASTVTVPEPPPTLAPTSSIQLALWIDEDRTTVDALTENWVPQLSAKRVGIEDRGIVYGFDEILDDHRAHREEYGAVLVDGGSYNFNLDGEPMTGWYMTIVPEPFDTSDGALTWCRLKEIGRDDCFAKFLSADPENTDGTIMLQ